MTPATDYMKNPISGEIKLVALAQAAHLACYGWIRTNADEYRAWFKAQVEYTTAQFVTGLSLH